MITLRTQGADEAVAVKVDGKRVAATRLDASTVQLRVPQLAKGPHDVALRIGQDLEEVQRGALIVR